jgi:tetratricopeptide (TPR) repeat protein
MVSALLCLSAAFAQDAAQIQLNRGLDSIQKGQPEQAIAPLREAALDNALAPEAHYLLGAAYFQLGDFSKIGPELAGLEDSLHAEHVLYLLEESYRLTHRTEEAKQAFRRLNSRFPDSAWLHFLMAGAYENQADHQKAIAEYQAALAKDPELPNAHFAIGYLYFQDQVMEEAKTWLQQELPVQSCHTLACYYLAEIARTGGETEEALRLYRRALECDARNFKAHVGLGILLSTLNRDSEAIDEFRSAARLSPDDAAPHYRLAVLYKKLGRTAEANAEYALVNRIHASGHAEAVEVLKAKP